MQEWKLGSYQLVRRLGEGGMAQVYLARDVRLGREVAVKVLDRRLADRSGFRERFLREARVAAALDHPNIVPLYDFGDENGVLFLVMPYVSGGSLQDQLARAPFSMSEVVAYGSQLTDALAYAHQRNLVHRDVKPANILIHADGRLMLSDFGLAKVLDSGVQPAATRNHPDAGTPEYMAPEQIGGRTESRSDLYGLGVVLYLLMTGRLPFSGSSSNAVMEAHLYRLPESPRRLNPDVTTALELVVMQALAKRPEDRFATASEMGAALMAALVAGDAAPLPFVDPISPLPYAGGMPGYSQASPRISTSQPDAGGHGYFVDASPYPSPHASPNPSGGRASLDAMHVAGASPLPVLPPTPLGTGFSNPTPGASGAQAFQGIAAGMENPPSPGHLPFPSDFGKAAPGSRPMSFSSPVEQAADAQLTYRAGEVSHLRSSQSSKSSRASRTAHENSGPRLSDSGVRMLAMRQALPETPSRALDAGRTGGSRLWMVWVAILALLLIAAIVLLRMAQTGTLFAF